MRLGLGIWNYILLNSEEVQADKSLSVQACTFDNFGAPGDSGALHLRASRGSGKRRAQFYILQIKFFQSARAGVGNEVSGVGCTWNLGLGSEFLARLLA